ncbi:hypothetical protein RCL1_003083 [Eukaryota sp. TZLM3-RCL]
MSLPNHTPATKATVITGHHGQVAASEVPPSSGSVLPGLQPHLPAESPSQGNASLVPPLEAHPSSGLSQSPQLPFPSGLVQLGQQPPPPVEDPSQERLQHEVPPSLEAPSTPMEDREHSDPPLPLPILPFPKDSGLIEILNKLADPFTLPEESPSSVPPPAEKVLEDPRIQTALNRLRDWAIYHRIPTEAIFGDQIQSPASFRPLPPKDPEAVKRNLPPAVPRPSCLDSNLQDFGLQDFPKSPVLNTDFLVSSLVAAPHRSDPDLKPTTLPKVRPLGTPDKPIPNNEDYLPFMREFSIWSREVNGSAPFHHSLPHSLSNPQLDVDIPRAFLKGVNPTGILQFLQPGLINVWKTSGYLNPTHWTERDLWYLVVLHSQYPDPSYAEQQLETTKMDWKIADGPTRWYDYLSRFLDVLSRLTLAGVLKGRPASEVRTTKTFVKQTFLANLGVLKIFLDLYPRIHFSPNELIQEFIPLVGKEHLSWCENKNFHQLQTTRLTEPVIDPDSGLWQSVPPRLQKAARAAQLSAARHKSPQTSRRQQSRQQSSKEDTSSDSDSECRFCHSTDHVIDDCPDPDCRRSRFFKSKKQKKPESRRRPRRGDKDSKRGAPPNKKSKYDVFSFKHRFIKHTSTSCSHTDHSGTLPRVRPSDDASSDVVVRYVASSPVPLREGSRRAGRRNDNKDSRLSRWTEFDAKLATVFGNGNPDAPGHNPYCDLSGHHLTQGDGYSDVDLFSIDYIDHTIHSIDPDLQPIRAPKLLKLHLLINDVPVTGVIDTGASCSVITKDLAMSTNMEILNDSIRYISANNVTTSSLGTAQGVLSFRLGSVANLVQISHRLPIIPGSSLLLIGIDILSELGLLDEEGLILRLDKEHSVILLSEAEFDYRILMADESSSKADVTPFASQLTDSGCTILLDDPKRTDSLVKLLHEYREVFSSLPHPDGIDCPPMEIPFHDPSAIVKIPPRRLNPEKQIIAEGIFQDLVEAGFAYFTQDSKFSSPVVLVTYPDHRKPRLTGDFSGSNGVNSHTIPVDPNLPRISDVLEFLSTANFIATLDLPKAFWQLNVATKDQEKTTLSIPGMSIAFRRACFGLKNVPAIFQNIMSSIFDIPGVFIYIDDVIIVASTFNDYIDKIRAVLTKARSHRVNIGLQKCTFSTCNHPIKILGHVFLNKTRSIDSSRISALVELPPPRNIKEVRSFVGSVNYLRDWLPQISEELAPIIELTKGSDSGNRAPPIKWNPDLQSRFEQIKRMIIDHVPLSLPSKDSNILISTDASDLAVGGVIWQEIPPCAPAGTPLINRKVAPLSFFSRILQNSQKNWSTIQKELVHSVELSLKPTSHDLYGPQEYRLSLFCAGKEPNRETMDPHPRRFQH